MTEQFSAKLSDLIPRLNRELLLHERGEFAKGSISFPQLSALEYICENENCSMRKLARALSSRESTTTGLIDRMIKLGLVRRTRSKKDRRVVLVTSTPKGKKIIRQHSSDRQKTFMSMFKPLTANERKTYLDIMEKVLRELPPDSTTD